MVIEGRIIDVLNRNINEGAITIKNGIITEVDFKPVNSGNYILPGLIDSHIHIESSMLVPSEFARFAVQHGTVAVVSDPHEIANVLGIDGVEYMLANAETSPLKFYFGAPSCVPATPFETSGASLDSESIASLLSNPRISYLSEVMNYPGVLNKSPDIMRKIYAAKAYGKPVDGHAPGLTGENLIKYVRAGITTDHECTSLNEAIEKINLGMKVLIRNGSAARNFDELHSLITSHNQMVMLCSDDQHPDDLLKGHINLLVRQALQHGHDIFNILTACTINPIRHYRLDVGLLRQGDPADFIIIDNLSEFNIIGTYIDGKEVYSENQIAQRIDKIRIVNNFDAKEISPDKLSVKFNGGKIRVIEVIPGELLTRSLSLNPSVDNGLIASDVGRDLLKICVINRYQQSEPSIGFIRNFGIKSGAVASSVAHDSHNIVCIGANDNDMTLAINDVILNKGGISISDKSQIHSLPLPIAGLMSDRTCQQVASKYTELDNLVRRMGSTLKSPLMTLSFMALIVIPELKLCDKGLFDVNKFVFVPLEIN